MSFINISNPKKRDEIVKSYLDIKKRIQQRNINEKLVTWLNLKTDRRCSNQSSNQIFKPASEFQKTWFQFGRNLNSLIKICIWTCSSRYSKNVRTTWFFHQQEGKVYQVLLQSKWWVRCLLTTYGKLSVVKEDNDPVFGIYNEGSNFKIGSKPIRIDGDDIFIDGHKWEMSRGMWSLLTKKESQEYTEDDLENYRQILYDTSTLYQQNDPNTGKRNQVDLASGHWLNLSGW